MVEVAKGVFQLRGGGRAVNLGVAGYLTKPFRVPQVLAAAAKALGE
jgi:CheY-like chemotaxis protein